MKRKDKLITYLEAAKILCVALNTIKSYVFRKLLVPCYKDASGNYFKLDCILSFNKPICGGYRSRNRSHTCVRKYDIDTKNGFKICISCNLKKSIDQFVISRKSGHNKRYETRCKGCQTIQRKIRISKDPGKFKAYNSELRIKNKQNPEFTINDRISANIRKSLNKAKGGRRWETLVGYTLQELKNHLECNFEKEMSWNNIGEWHIHHVIPKRLFKYDSYDSQEFKICWSLNNLMPKMGIDNIREQDNLDDGRRARDLSDDERLDYLKSKGYSL